MVEHRSRLLLSLLTLLIPAAATSTACVAQEAAALSEALRTSAEPASGANQTSETGVDDAADATASEESAEIEEQAPAFDDIAWELRPYRVLISLGLGDRRLMNASFAGNTLEALDELLRGYVGPYWQPTLQINDWMFPQSKIGIEQLTSEELTERFRAADYDKVLVAVLESDGVRLRLSGREWDRSNEGCGPVKTRQIVDRRRVAPVVFELLHSLFRPLAEIETVEGSRAEVRIRGGELLSRDSALFPVAEGDWMTSYFRYLDREGQVRQIQMVPWTYLRIDEIQRSRALATIETPFSSPLAGSRRRVELIAMRIEASYPQTRLTLSPRTNPNKPLVGFRVRIYKDLPSEENPSPEKLDLMTDRFGTVAVPAFPNSPLRRMIVHSGGAVLSNVPFIPGVEPATAMQLPDDSPRLQVEGSLAMVQGDLIDVVSRRAVMMSRAISLARQEKFEDADRLLTEIDAQPSIASFESRILAIRVPAVDQARANRDRSQEKRIRMMCSDLETLVRKYLDRDKVKEVKIEVDELKRIAGR